LHAVGASVHAQGAADGTGDADEALHAAEVVLGAVCDGAAEVGCGVNVCEISFQDDVGFGSSELEDDPREFTVADKKIRTAAKEFVGDLPVVEKLKQARNGFVPTDEEHVGGAADSEGRVFGKRNGGPMLDVELGDAGEKLRAIKTHDEWDAPFRVKP
jgi:hypothetical protein